MKSFISLLSLLLFQCILHAQEGNVFQSTFELQSSISYVKLLGGEARVLDASNDGLYNFKRSAYDQKGLKFELGALANRQINNNLWLRSGIQLSYLKSRSRFSTEETYDDSIDKYVNTNDLERDPAFRSLQIPFLLEYQHDFGKWKGYGNLGLTISHALLRTRYKQNYFDTFYFEYIYDPSCDCFPSGIAIPSSTPSGFDVPAIYQNTIQFAARGLLGFGAIIKGRNGRSWRLGYNLAMDMHPFHKGNNTRKVVYENYNDREATQRHIFHQLEFAMQWPERSILLNEDKNKPLFSGWLVGFSTSLQLPARKKEYNGRTGLGWGRNVQLKFISNNGFGGRIQTGKWISPESFYATKSDIIKGEFIYQLPTGLEFSAGFNQRKDIDVDGGGGTIRALVFGTGGTIPLNQRMGFMIDLGGYYFPWELDEKSLVEVGLGFGFRVFK